MRYPHVVQIGYSLEQALRDFIFVGVREMIAVVSDDLVESCSSFYKLKKEVNLCMVDKVPLVCPKKFILAERLLGGQFSREC